MRHVAFLIHPGVLDQAAVPSRVQVAGIAPASVGAELDDVDAVAALCLPDGMEWLVNVPDEVNDELERLDAVVAGRTLVAQYPLEVLDPVHHAVLVVVLRSLVRVLRAIAVPRIGEALCVLGNIDEVPAKGLVALGANLVRPIGDRGERVVADQRLDIALGDLGQALLRDVGDDAMPLLPPAVRGRLPGRGLLLVRRLLFSSSCPRLAASPSTNSPPPVPSQPSPIHQRAPSEPLSAGRSRPTCRKTRVGLPSGH